MRVKVSCSELRVSNLGKLRNLGLTYREIGKLYGTSCVQIHYWLNGRHPARLRAKPGVCEICGRTGPLNHHHWGDPRVGLWLCPRCHMAADALDKVPGFASTYFRLKGDVEAEFVSLSALCASS